MKSSQTMLLGLVSQQNLIIKPHTFTQYASHAARGSEKLLHHFSLFAFVTQITIHNRILSSTSRFSPHAYHLQAFFCPVP